MSMFDELDLGAKDYSGKGEGSGFEKFLSKPSPRPYQPFGGPMQQAYQPQPEPVDYSYGEAPVDQGPTFYDDLDAYEQLKNGHKQISQFSRENSKSAKRYEDLYGEFMDNEFKPFFESVGGFGDFESDDEYISAVDEIYKSNLKASQQEDGWLGASDEKTRALEGLKNFQQWDHPNGMRAKFLRLKAEKDKRREVADRAKDEEFKFFEQLTNISIPAREALDESLKSRNKAPGSAKKMNEMLDGMSWEQPIVGYDGEVQNLESVDPRAKINPAIGYDGQGNKSSKAQKERVAAAMRGDIKGVLSRRQHIAKGRQLRDKGFFFSESGLLDGRPIGMSRRDVDLLDIDDMRKAGMTSFQGKPLDQAMADLGGEERLEMAKVMQSVYSTKSNYEDAQLKFLKAAGGPKADKLRDAMEAAREDMQKTIGLAASYGLDNELFEQAETTGWLSAMGNAVQRGALMSEMSNYTPDFLTNTLDADEMQRFIEIASEIEKLPTSSTMKRVKETKSDGFLDAMGNLLFDNPAAIPEMFVESLSSFLPSTIKWLLPSAAAGAAAGTIVAPGAGTAAGAAIGARASWGVASFVLEASGMALEGMQELNIDWKNPKVFAAAWTNESIRSKIQKKMVQKGTPIAIADMLTGMMAGKVMGVVNHTGNAVFKGGKLLNKEAFNAANGAVPRFKLMQKTRNAAAELGADSFMGMSGEYLGQWASKEPGEDWDWDAIAAEGLVGVGPGAVGAALEMRGPRANYFGNAPIDITGETQTETGSTGTVNRAGYQANYQTFNDPESMMAHFEDVVPQGTTPEDQDRRAASLDFTRRWVTTMFKIRPEAMAGLKVVISDRTPDANLKNRGTFESRDGNNIIYLNEKEFAQDPMGAMLHESGHFARIMMLKDEELTKLWGGLKEGEQLDAYTQYYTKDYERSFEEHDEKTQKKIRRAFNKTDNEVLAEEWFSYQWARVLNSNYKPDKSVKGLEKFYSGLVRPLFAEFTGSEKAAGDKKGNEFMLDEQIRQFLEDGFTPSMQTEIDNAQAQRDALGALYEEGLPTQKESNRVGKARSKIPGQLQKKLKAMGLAPKKAAQMARTLNAMAGEKILSTDPSFYTNMERGSLKAAGADIEEGKPESEKRPENQDPMFIESAEGLANVESVTTFEKGRPKTYESKSDKESPRAQGSNRKQASRPGAEPYFASGRDYGRVKDKLEKVESKRDRPSAKKTLKKTKNLSKDTLKRQAESLEKKALNDRVRLAKKSGEVNRRKTAVQARDAEMKRLDLLLKNMSKSDRIKLGQAINAAKNAFPDIETLDRKLDAAMDELGPEASSGQIISRLLNLEELTELAPRSFTKEMRKLLQESRGKLASNEDIEDVSFEITDEILDIKEQLRTRVDEIDKQIASLQKGASQKPKAASQKPEAGETTVEAEIDALKNARKLVKTYLEAVAPEELSIEWKDIPAHAIFYASNGKKYSAEPMTLGQLADRRDGFKKGQLYYKNSKGELVEAKNESRTGQEILWDHISKFDIEQTGKTTDFGYTKDGELIKPRKYELILEAVKASAYFRKSAAPKKDGGVGADPMGVARFEKTGQGQSSPKGYARKDPQGFEVSSTANTNIGKAFSAFNAKLSDGKSIEYHYQVNVKGYPSIKAGKGKPPKDTSIDSYGEYKKLWERFAKENPKKIKALKKAAAGRVLTDRYATTEVNQARALYEILAEPSNREAQKGYPAGYQSNKGTNYAALIASRLGILNSMKPLSNDPSPSEILALKMANGRALELLGDPTETERDFNKAIYIALLEELGVEQSGMLSDPVLVEERDYAETEEYTRGALEKISNGTPVVAAIAGIPSTSKRQAFQRQVRDDDAASAQTEIVESKKMDRPDETNPVWEEYGKKGQEKAAPEIKRKGTSEVVLNINGLKVPSARAYKARRPDEDLDKPVPETEQHQSFTRGKVYETFDVVTSFAEGRTKREVAKFNKNRTNIQKSEELPTNPISIERENADLLSTTDINAAEFAEWYMSGKPESQMEDLQLVPSSKNNQQAKGGLGEGFLPYVFLDFARAMYKKLGLIGIAAETMEQAREAEKAAAKSEKGKYSNFKWNLEQGALLENGKINPKQKIFTKPADRMTPVGMAIIAKPIVQAVIDARGVDIYNQIDRSASVLLQRDIDRAEQEGSRESLQDGAFVERGEEMQELGAVTQDIFNPDSETLSQEDAKKGVVSAAEKALDENPDVLKNKDSVSDELLEELYYSSTSNDLTNAAEKELQRRGIKALYVVREETADQLNKILNSDAGTGVWYRGDTAGRTKGLINLAPNYETSLGYARGGYMDEEAFDLDGDAMNAEASKNTKAFRPQIKKTLDLIKSAEDRKVLGSLDDMGYRWAKSAIKMIRDLEEYPNWWANTKPNAQEAWEKALIPQLKKLGYDSILFRDDYHDTLAVFDVSQLKPVSPKTLNSDAKILTSDADPNLAKATLLGRIAGDSELIKEFKEWAGGKKQSLSKGSLKMDLVDRADPLNQLNKLFLKGFEAVGLDSSNPLYKALNVYGKYYQFFGEGDNSVEQARLEYYEPMMELMREYNVDEKKIGEYLNARAAPSRNLQIEAKALEALKEMEKDPEGPKSEKYKKIEKFFFNTTEDGKRTIKRDSGISTETALKVVAEMEKEPRFVEFLDKFLIKYYKMNKEGLTTLASTGMIGQDTVSKEGINEVEAMRKAMSRFDFKGGKADKYGNKYKSKVSALEDNYSYSPLQGFEGETENFYEQEAAWEEFGAGSNATGKGFDQKKSDLILQGAFGRYKSGAPDPSLTLGNSFRQHISSAILAQKNTVAQKFGMVYGMMRAVIYDKDGNEHFNANRLTEEDKNDPIYQAYEELIKLKEPGNETAFKNLKSEFDQIFDPKGFEESETVTQYELHQTGEIGIVRREMSQKFKNDPTAFTYRRNGIPQFIKFTSKSEGLRMADTMKNLRYENLPQILQGFNTVTRGMAQMFTSANPAFILPNFFRDVATAAIHLGEDDKKVLIKDALNFKNLSGFMKEIYKVEQKIHKGINPNTKDKEIMNLLASGDPKKILASGNRQAMFQYFKEAGGKVGYFRHESLPEKIKQIQKDLKGKKGWTKKGWKGMWQTIDSMNTAVENSIRASTFWAAIKDGRSTDEAAHISRNVTVDFNQKGNLTQTFGALYVFFGASVNSMHRFYRTLSRRTPAQRAALIGGMASAALIVNLFNRLMDDDEDEEIPDYDTISTYKRDTNFILPVPAGLPDFFNDEKDTGYFSLPLPLGYNLFWTMGQVMGDMVAKNVFNRGGMGFFGSATRVQESFLNAFNPVGGASLITAAFPTAVTPLVELYANKNFMNKPIRYADRPFEVPKPAHMQDPRSTPDHWTKLSRSINEFMGGSDDVKGSLAGMMGKNPLYYNSDEDIEFDISGNQMKHLLYGYLGGPGQIADTLFGGMFSAAKGDLSVKNIGDIPVANRFMRATTYGSATRNSFLNLRDATKNAEKVIKSAKIIGPKVYTTALNDNKKLLQLSSQISAFDKQKNKMRRLKKQIESSKALSDNQKTQRVDELQKKELTLMIAVIKKAQALGIS